MAKSKKSGSKKTEVSDLETFELPIEELVEDQVATEFLIDSNPDLNFEEKPDSADEESVSVRFDEIQSELFPEGESLNENGQIEKLFFDSKEVDSLTEAVESEHKELESADAEVSDEVVNTEVTDESADIDEVTDELAAYAGQGDEENLIELDSDRVISIIESLLFASDKPISLDIIKQAFKGTNIKSPEIKRALEQYRLDLANATRGVILEEIAGGYQIRTRSDNQDFLRRSVKNRVFKLSGPALEVLSIIAYKQPIVKAEVDEIRGVDSGHLIRALMDRSLVKFAGKSELPGKPMFYETTRKFLEVFGLRNLRELPSAEEIDDLIPEGIGEPSEGEGRNLSAITSELSVAAGETYSQGEQELLKIGDELSAITTTTDFFEKEKARQKAEKDSQKAQDVREAIILGQSVEPKDIRWLERYKKNIAQQALDAASQSAVNSEVQPLPDEITIQDEPVQLNEASFGDYGNQADVETIEVFEEAVIDADFGAFAEAQGDHSSEVPEDVPSGEANL